MVQTALTTTAADLAGPNKYRNTILFRHISSANNVGLGNCKAASLSYATADIILQPGDMVAVSTWSEGSDQVRDNWSAITDSGSVTLVWKEFSGPSLDLLVGIVGLYYNNLTNWLSRLGQA